MWPPAVPSRREVPAGRWPLAADDLYAPHIAPDKVYSKRGCFVDDFACDLTGLNISRDELNRLDPMFHLLLHAGKAAWQNTITKNIDPARVGIIIGNIALPTDAASAFSEEILAPLFAEQVTGTLAKKSSPHTDPLNRYVAGLPAAILAKALGVHGTAFTLDAACASSLYALKLAAEELRAGRADLMLTGGLSRPDCLYTQMGFSQLHALSPSGNCAPFDAHADGLVVGEGAGIIALKRLEDALRDGDHIYATIAGIGLSNDIAGNLMQPDSSGQLRAMHAAYEQACWSPNDVDLIECHGTGTPIGDAVEFNSLTQLWQTTPASEKRCVIGSVKSNVGHLLTAAGSAGLIKVLLAMKHQQLPPTANFHVPANDIALATSPFTLLREAANWPRRKENPRRAAISGFGFGGINAHVLIEQWEPAGAPPSAPGSAGGSSDGSQNSHILNANPLAEPGADGKFAYPAKSPPSPSSGWAPTSAPGKPSPLSATASSAPTPPVPTHPARWWGSPEQSHFTGYFINQINIPLGRFRIPPAELAEMLPQQLLMLQVAADALEDAGLGHTPGDRLDTGVFIGIGLDLNTTNYRFRWTLAEKARRWSRDLHLTPAQLDQWTEQLRTAAGPALNANRTMGGLGGIVASRIARPFHVGGPSFTISSEETSALNALEVAMRALQRNEINIALVGAVDLAGDLRAALGQHATHPATQSQLLGEGAGAIILKRLEDALRDGDRIYAIIPHIESSHRTTSPAWKGAGPGTSENPHPIDLTNDVPAATPQPVPFQAGLLADAQPQIGNTGAASSIASVLKAALALHHETIPPTADTPARYWLRDRAQGPRRATVQTTAIGGTHAIVAPPIRRNCHHQIHRPRRQPSRGDLRHLRAHH